MTESQASDMWALLRPAFGAFLPEGSEAKRYLMTLKVGCCLSLFLAYACDLVCRRQKLT